MSHPDSILGPGQDTLLDLKLDALRIELASITAPTELEAALVKRFRAAGPVAARPRLWWMPPLALAAAIAMTSWVIRGPVPDGQPLVALAPQTLDGDPGPFLALRPLERIANAPGTTLVTTEFPRALLAEWGLPVAPELAADPVRAQMLYSADGEPLAVRLLN